MYVDRRRLTNQKKAFACGERFVIKIRVSTRKVTKKVKKKKKQQGKWIWRKNSRKKRKRDEVALMQCVLFPSPVHSPSCNHVKLIDCTTIKGKLTARKPCQATALGGELPLSLESSKSLISDVLFLLFCRKRSVRFCSCVKSYTSEQEDARLSFLDSFLANAYTHTRTRTQEYIYIRAHIRYTHVHTRTLSTDHQYGVRRSTCRPVSDPDETSSCPACASDLVLASMICVRYSVI